MPDHERRNFAVSDLHKVIGEILTKGSASTSLDQDLEVAYATVLESLLTDNTDCVLEFDGKDLPVEWAPDTLQTIPGGLSQGGEKDRLSALHTIARSRAILLAYVQVLTEVPLDPVVQESLELEANRLLNTPCGPVNAPSLSRSVKLFFLKAIERKKGITYLRSVLQQEPLSTSQWLLEWRALREGPFERFLGHAKLPRGNPFSLLPGYETACLAVSALLNTGDVSGLNSVQNPGAMLGVVFHEVFLSNVLDAGLPRGVEKLQQFTCQMKAVSDPKWGNSVGLAEFLASDYTSRKGKGSPAQEFLSLRPESVSLDILQVRVILHIACAAFSGATGEDFRLSRCLRSLIAEPESCVGSYLPGMPEDMQAQVIAALGGRWFQCRNGHSYYVDQCGRPTEVLKCWTCGVDIGGMNHNLMVGQTDVDAGNEGNEGYGVATRANDKSPQGYGLAPSSQSGEKNSSPLRSLPPLSALVVKILVHACLVTGSAVGGDAWDILVSTKLVNKELCDIKQGETSQHFVSEFKANWADMTSLLGLSDDDTATVLHRVAEEMGKDSQPLPDAGATHTEEEAEAHRRRWNEDVGVRDLDADMVSRLQADSEDARVLGSLQVRNSWELTLHRRHLSKLLKPEGLGERLRIVNEAYCDSDEASIFLGELMESGDPEMMALEDRKAAVPMLWRYRRAFTMDDFSKSLTHLDPEGTVHPVLSSFLQDESQYGLLRHIPGVLDFIGALHLRYNRRISREEARSITFGDFLKEAEVRGNVGVMRSAFDSYQAAMDGSLQYMDRFGCTPIPASFKATRVTESLPISFALIGRTDEFILPLALLQWMSGKHNEFVQRVDEVLLLRQKESQRYATANPNLSSSLLVRSHALDYDLGLVESFVEKQCVERMTSGELKYDFAKAEDHLLDRFFTDKPVIDLEIREFEFPGDSLAAKRELLQGKIAQTTMPGDLEQAIRNELSTPARAAGCLRAVEMSISFITVSTTGLHASVATKSLDSYIKETLLMDSDVLQSRVVTKEVQLQHLDDLCELLDELASPDPFEKVNPFFKATLSEYDEAILETACTKMDLNVLVPALFKFIKSHVRTAEETYSAIGGDAGWLGYAETDGGDLLCDMPWFDEFPEHLKMANIVAVYTALQKMA